MNKHKLMKETRVTPVGMVPLANAEAAQCGMAALVRNMRECEDAMQVTGNPAPAGAIDEGDRLLLIDGDHHVTCHGRVVKIDGVTVVTVDDDIVGAHAVGHLVVIVTRGGFVYLSRHDGAWTVLDPEDAVPRLTLGARCVTSSADIAAYTFAEPYSQWRAPLSDVDTSALRAILRTAWNVLADDAAAMGHHVAPMLVRWAVRLHDDSYLWMSDPVRVGDETLANANRITAIVNTSNSGFTGTQATTMPMVHYSLDIGVTRGVAAQWLPLVKSIDVLATTEARLLAAGGMLDYRCFTRTTGGREYLLEMGLARRGAADIAAQLAASPWQLVATAPAATVMTGADFVAPVEAVTLTGAQCGAVGAMTSLTGVVCSTTAGGRLYCCTGSGDIVVSIPGNALVEAYRRSVLGTVPLAMAVVTRPLYSGGFGRYPVYVFTDDGIYAVPQGATGRLGEARLVDRTVIAADVPPVEAGRDVWLVTRHGQLCRLGGSQLTVCHHDGNYRAMAWSDAFQELWLLPADGFPVVMMPCGRMSVRTVAAVQLYSDPRHAVAVSAAGQVMDLEREQEALMPVAWRSHPIAMEPLMGRVVKRVVWHVSRGPVDLTLKVTGQRGIMAHESDVSLMTVTGEVSQPLATPAIAVPCRTLRLQLDGEAQSGTLLLPTHLHTTPKRPKRP